MTISGPNLLNKWDLVHVGKTWVFFPSSLYSLFCSHSFRIFSPCNTKLLKPFSYSSYWALSPLSLSLSSLPLSYIFLHVPVTLVGKKKKTLVSIPRFSLFLVFLSSLCYHMVSEHSRREI